MKWIYLLIAGALEITWAVAMKMSNGFTVSIPSIVTGVGYCIASVVFFAIALRQPDKKKLRGRDIDYLIYNSDYNKDNPPRLDEEATIENINRLIKRSGLSNEKIAESWLLWNTGMSVRIRHWICLGSGFGICGIESD